MNNNESDNHHLIRVIFLGDPKVGKTCILYQLFSSVFKDEYVVTSSPFPSLTQKATYGVEFAPLIVNLEGGKSVDVQICDAAGGESSRAMVLSILKTCPMAIVVYDVTDAPSFDNVEKWIADLKEKAGDDVLLGILGNKIDLENRVVNTEDGERLAKKHSAVFAEVSSKHPSDLESFIKRVGSTLLANNIPT